MSGARRSAVAGVHMGVGLAAFLDEVVFHQLLHWHHFYDGAGATAALVSDGFFHAAGWIAVVAGLFTYADLQRRGDTVRRRVTGGVLTGRGGFQLYDGLVQHKLLGLHQIRYDVDLLGDDLAWNTAGGIGLGVGLLLLTRPRRARRGVG